MVGPPLPAAESLAQGWREAQTGENLPIEKLWDENTDHPDTTR